MGSVAEPDRVAKPADPKFHRTKPNLGSQSCALSGLVLWIVRIEEEIPFKGRNDVVQRGKRILSGQYHSRRLHWQWVSLTETAKSYSYPNRHRHNTLRHVVPGILPVCSIIVMSRSKPIGLWVFGEACEGSAAITNFLLTPAMTTKKKTERGMTTEFE